VEAVEGVPKTAPKGAVFCHLFTGTSGIAAAFLPDGWVSLEAATTARPE